MSDNTRSNPPPLSIARVEENQSPLLNGQPTPTSRAESRKIFSVIFTSCFLMVNILMLLLSAVSDSDLKKRSDDILSSSISLVSAYKNRDSNGSLVI
jgi:hypothetical protein